jgi:hypothetical protein
VVIGAVVVAGAGTWLALRPNEPAGNAPTPIDTGEGPSPTRAPDPAHELATPAAKAPKEGIASADERIFLPPDWPPALRIQVPGVPESLEVSGAVLRDALVATPLLHVRWESEAAREAFVQAKFRMPRELTMPESRGAPLPMLQGAMREAGFTADLDPPVLRIRRGVADAPRDQPR